jgi:DNA-binding NarL/FixJ family response regulator
LAKKKAAGIKLGAPSKDPNVIEQVRRFKARGASNQAIAQALMILPSTVVKYLLIEKR